MQDRERIAAKTVNEVKAALCAAIIRKPDFSLRELADVADAIGCEVKFNVEPSP